MARPARPEAQWARRRVVRHSVARTAAPGSGRHRVLERTIRLRNPDRAGHPRPGFRSRCPLPGPGRPDHHPTLRIPHQTRLRRSPGSTRRPPWCRQPWCRQPWCQQPQCREGRLHRPDGYHRHQPPVGRRR
jgi:hypothetical protein